MYLSGLIRCVVLVRWLSDLIRCVVLPIGEVSVRVRSDQMCCVGEVSMRSDQMCCIVKCL